MPNLKIKIWDALNSEEEYAKELDIFWPYELSELSELDERTTTISTAAENWVKSRWADLDYPDEIEVRMRMPDGRLLELIVTAEPATTFRATPKPSAAP